ncbi:hypothetical protein [Mycobacterium sp. SM3041]|uniref:hypothetical protein n=1 Tax=Mycobacterium sp. SM3041 TaxID=3114291 RepID=UPI003204D215
MKSVIMGMGAAALAMVAFAPVASAAPAAPADAVINDLRAEGYLVQINQTPTAPLTACSVSNVRKLDGGAASALVDVVCPDGC